MPTPIQFPDGQYDHSQPWWNNTNDRVMYERAFTQGTREEILQAQALMCNMAPSNFVREQMTVPLETPQFGAMSTQPTIDDVFAGQFTQSGNLVDRAPTDFSGTTAGVESSSIPSIPYWS